MSLSPDVLQFLRRRALDDAGRVQGSTIGRHRAASRSQGRDFLEYRAYAPGDDFREIDWRTSGRVDRVVVRQTEGEQRLGLMVALDASGAMTYGEGESMRWRYAQQIVEAVGWLANRQSDALGIVAGAADRVQDVALPVSSRFTDPVQIETRFSSLHAEGRCPWPELVGSVRQRMNTRGTVLIISDLLDLAAAEVDDPAGAARDLFSALGELRTAGHHVVVLQLLHPDELDFPWTDAAQVRFECSRGVRGQLETDARMLRDTYQAGLRGYLETLDLSAARHQVPLVRTRTDAALIATLAELLDALAGHVPAPGPGIELTRERPQP
jgi:uncharacterized protein (DUF58 family)